MAKHIFQHTLGFILLLALPFGVFCQDSAEAPVKADNSTAVRKVSPTSNIGLRAGKSLSDSASGVVQIRSDSASDIFMEMPVNPFVQVNGPLVFHTEKGFVAPERDAYFYLLAGLLFGLGLIRLSFNKYFSNLFSIFFTSTFRQKSIREQLLQNKAASLALNAFFCLSAGLFLQQLAVQKGWTVLSLNWSVLGACILIVAVTYTVKVLGLHLSGWIFGMTDAAEIYIFIVSFINKMLGLFLLPASVFLALGTEQMQPVVMFISLAIIAAFYLYRFIIAVPVVRNYGRISAFHFFIYLCAFEIVPVLLIYKMVWYVIK